MTVDGRDKYHLALAPPRTITGAISLSQVHLHKPRRNPEGPEQAREPQYPMQRHNLYLSLPRAVPGDPKLQGLGDTCTRSSPVTSQTEGGCLPRGTGLIMWYRGKAFADCTRLIMEQLGEEPMSGKWMESGGLGRNRYVKIQV